MLRSILISLLWCAIIAVLQAPGELQGDERQSFVFDMLAFVVVFIALRLGRTQQWQAYARIIYISSWGLPTIITILLLLSSPIFFTARHQSTFANVHGALEQQQQRHFMEMYAGETSTLPALPPPARESTYYLQ